jgi:hypothetical protein
MSKLLVLFFIGSLLSGADVAHFHMKASVGSKPTRARMAQSNPNGVTVFPGDDVLPQMADGSGWKTQIILVNLATVRLSFTLDFWRSDGSYWEVTIAGVGTGDQLNGVLSPGATVVLETAGQGSLVQGWAELTYDYEAGKIGGLGVFRQTVSGRPDFEAVAPLSSLFDSQIVLPYDNTAGFTTGIACVNGSHLNAATITATFREQDGTTYATETILLPASGHTAFAMPARFPATQGKRGTVLFRSSTDFFSVLGLRFGPGGAFTSFNGMNTIEMIQ